MIGQAILKKANELATKDGVYSGSYFTPILYFKYGRYLTEKARENLLDDLRISVAPGNWLRVTKQGYGNVNIPQKGAQNNILAGEALGNVGIYHDAFDYGMKLLQDLLDIVNDCGGVPEYNSPTYTGASLAPLATIAGCAKNKEAVLKARLLQEVIFLDVCSRYHEPTNQIAGPYSRAYLPGRMGGAGGTKYALYKLLPQGLFIGFKADNQFLGQAAPQHVGDPRSMVYHASVDYSYPDFMNLLAVEKVFPYEIRNTCKTHGGRWDQDTDTGGRLDMACYMTEEYSLASSSREYVNCGQSSGVVLFWRKSPVIQSISDFRTMVWAYMIDEKKFGPSNKYAGIDAQYWLLDEGCYHTVQNRNKVIVLYQMKKLGTMHSCLRLNCYVPLFGSLDELWAGDKRIETFPQHLSHSEPLFIKDGDTFVALRFLAPTNLGVEHEVVISVIEEGIDHPRTLGIACFNYSGAERSFTFDEIDMVRSGFIVEVGSTKEYGSLESFRKHVNSAKVDETLSANGVWAVRYESGGESLSIVYHLRAHEIIERRIDGEALAVPMFTSPLVKCDRNGHIEIGKASLDTCFGLPVWLMADEKHGVYMVMNLNGQAVPVALKTPDGELKTDALPLGRIIYQPKSVKTLEILSAEGLAPVHLKAKVKQPKILVNDVPVSNGNLKKTGPETWVFTVLR